MSTDSVVAVRVSGDESVIFGDNYSGAVEAVSSMRLEEVLASANSAGFDDEICEELSKLGKSFIATERYFNDAVVAEANMALAVGSKDAAGVVRRIASEPDFLASLAYQTDQRDLVLDLIEEAFVQPFAGSDQTIAEGYLDAYACFAANGDKVRAILDYLFGTAEDDTTPLFHLLAHEDDIKAMTDGSISYAAVEITQRETPDEELDLELPEELMGTLITQRQRALDLNVALQEFSATFHEPLSKIEQLLSMHDSQAEFVQKNVERRLAFTGNRVKEHRQLLRDLEQPPSNGAKRPQPIHQEIPQDRAADMVRLILAIDEHMTSPNARDVKPETIARRITRFTDEETQLAELRDRIKTVADISGETLEDKPMVARLLELPTRPLHEIVADLVVNYERSENGNGIKASVREHLGRDTAERVSQVIAALKY